MIEAFGYKYGIGCWISGLEYGHIWTPLNEFGLKYGRKILLQHVAVAWRHSAGRLADPCVPDVSLSPSMAATGGRPGLPGMPVWYTEARVGGVRGAPGTGEPWWREAGRSRVHTTERVAETRRRRQQGKNWIGGKNGWHAAGGLRCDRLQVTNAGSDRLRCSLVLVQPHRLRRYTSGGCWRAIPQRWCAPLPVRCDWIDRREKSFFSCISI